MVKLTVSFCSTSLTSFDAVEKDTEFFVCLCFSPQDWGSWTSAQVKFLAIPLVGPKIKLTWLPKAK